VGRAGAGGARHPGIVVDLRDWLAALRV